MNMNEIMDDFNHNQDNLPILTEIVRHAAITTGRINRGVVNMRLAVIEPDANGYDPYNSAPPVPVEKDSIE